MEQGSVNPIAEAASERAAATSSAALTQDTGSAANHNFLLASRENIALVKKIYLLCPACVQHPRAPEGTALMHRQGNCWIHTKSSHGMMAAAPACSAFLDQLCSCLYLGDFLVYCFFCTVMFQCRLIAIVTAPGRREDYLINVCEALLDPHMKAAKKRNV